MSYFSAFNNHVTIHQNFMSSNLVQLIPNLNDIRADLNPFQSFERQLTRQSDAPIQIMFIPKDQQKKLTQKVRIMLYESILQAQAVELQYELDDSNYREAVYVCNDLNTVLWLLNVTQDMRNEHKLQLTTIDDYTSYSFYGNLPQIYSDGVLRKLPKCNNNFECCSKWKAQSDRANVIFEVDLISACSLFRQQFTMQLEGQVFDLALICEDD